MDRLNKTISDYKNLFANYDSRSLQNADDNSNSIISSNFSVEVKDIAIIDLAECHYISNFSFTTNIEDIPTFKEYLKHWLYADQEIDYMIMNRLKSKVGSKPNKLKINPGNRDWIDS